jgi:thymidylate synthase (FAD)
MHVKLVSITSPKIKDIKNSENLIVYCARVSNPSNQLNYETNTKLIEFLIKNKHWSPFEMVDMTLEIQTSRAIAAQILRHRSFSFQEFSQRYSTATNFEEIELRLQGNKNRQVGEELIKKDDPCYLQLQEQLNQSIKNSYICYEEMLKRGVAREVARLILPLCTTTVLYMKGSLRSWMHYIALRTENNTQKEHRLVAQHCEDIFKNEFPNVYNAYIKFYK